MRWTEWVEAVFERVVQAPPPRALGARDLVPDELRDDQDACEAAKLVVRSLTAARMIFGSGNGITLNDEVETARGSSVAEALSREVDGACNGMFRESRDILLLLAERAERPGTDYASYTPVDLEVLGDAAEGANIANFARYLHALQERKLVIEENLGHGRGVAPSLVGFLCAARHEDRGRQAYLEVLEAARRAYARAAFTSITIRFENGNLCLTSDAKGINDLSAPLD